MKTCAILLFASLLCAQQPQQSPQPPQQPSEPTITRSQADTIITELRAIRELLEKGVLNGAAKAAPDVPVKAKLTLQGGEWLGKKDAPITMVEYADYQCPYCRLYHQDTFDQIVKTFVDSGQVRYTTRDLPLDIHPNAVTAAHAARCAGEQQQFWKMRDVLIMNDKLSLTAILGYAKNLKLNSATFKTCMDSGRYKDAILKESAEADKNSISATPTFVIGITTAEGVDGEVFIGAQSFSDFAAKFKEILANPARP